MNYAYLGPEGTYTHEAAAVFGDGAALTAFPTIERVLGAVCAGDCGAGVCPIDNVIEGAVNATIDTLIFGVPLYITRKLALPINHALLFPSQNGRAESVTAADVEAIASHPQALAQCGAYIAKNFPNARIIETASTAAAAEFTKRAEKCAAIAAPAAAALYGLDFIARDISDIKDNETQFVEIKAAGRPPERDCYAACAFSTENRPGGLYSILDIFAIWDVNLTKILSRPLKGRRGEYVFFAELECGAAQSGVNDVKDALKMVERKSSFYRFLGAYSYELR